MSTANIKRGDTKALFIDTLMRDGTPVDLTGCTLKFIMRRRTRPAKHILKTATIVSPVAGDVSYTPELEDIDTEGVYDQEWEVTFPSGKVLTFPNNEFNTVNILRDLADAPVDV